MPETPPRTWGRLTLFLTEEDDAGNTPTHVGKTNCTIYGILYKRKHPHARGEDQVEKVEVLVDEETPPRTWGRPSFYRGHVHSRRNTPTHVGKTKNLHSLARLNMETPPRTWGRPYYADPEKRKKRNTPTHVGKTEKKT